MCAPGPDFNCTLGAGELTEDSLCPDCAGPRSISPAASLSPSLRRRGSRRCRRQRSGTNSCWCSSRAAGFAGAAGAPGRAPAAPGRDVAAGSGRERAVPGGPGEGGAVRGAAKERSRRPGGGPAPVRYRPPHHLGGGDREPHLGVRKWGNSSVGLAHSSLKSWSPRSRPGESLRRGEERTSGGGTSGSGRGRGRGEDRAEPAAPGPPFPPPLPAPPPRTTPPGAGSRPGPCEPESPAQRRRARRCTMAAENRSAAGGGAPWGLPGESLLGGCVCTGRGTPRAPPESPCGGGGQHGLKVHGEGGCAPLRDVAPGRPRNGMVSLHQLSRTLVLLREPRACPAGRDPCIGSPPGDVWSRAGLQPCQDTGTRSGTSLPCSHPNQHRSPGSVVQGTSGPSDHLGTGPVGTPPRAYEQPAPPRAGTPTVGNPGWGLFASLLSPLRRRFVFWAGNYLHVFFASLYIPTKAAGTRFSIFWILCSHTE